MADEAQSLTVPDADRWWAWLGEHHGEAPAGVWLTLAKGGAREPTSLTYAEALEAALAFGWIDGQTRRCDEACYCQRWTPRRARSIWSKRNVGYAERLIAEGRMQPAGLAEVERARTDGRWAAAYEGPANAKVPDDLAAALAAVPRAQAMFELLTSQNRFSILHRVANVKREETRRRKIEEYVAMLARGETIHPQKAGLD
jgi:uncharacterized protein YdeI (YjbR/CyaY-like superfamily)